MVSLHCCTSGFSSCGEQGLLSSCNARASHSGGFSRCRVQTLGSQASLVAVCGLSSPSACGILLPQPGIEPKSPVLEGVFLTPGPPG